MLLFVTSISMCRAWSSLIPNRNSNIAKFASNKARNVGHGFVDCATAAKNAQVCDFDVPRFPISAIMDFARRSFTLPLVLLPFAQANVKLKNQIVQDI